ncbi:MAG TPA: hemerythrin domain-containing protein [Nocardioides sp.]|uniref:Hemerythrin superfamily protein n=1 Tax=Nocardioides daedukensis TaxID=634462 RepID=A0A7Y9RV61_9ACTN|nr:hemerythrin domain-containing protein [Nocardioides daedukensis]NYG57231.1 hemerythrin superfamily protein [Nocardioides daedukensis]
MSQDVIDLIMRDHREMERMFEQLKSDPDSRPALVPVLTTLLTAHSRAEESEVYPAAREEAGGAEDVEHSQEEHLLADKLALELGELDPGTSEFDSKLAELIDAVSHHVEEEEETVLPTMREGLSADRRAELGEAFLSTRQEHLGDQAEDITKDQLRQQAENLDMPVGDRTKDQLQDDLLEKGDK